MVLVVVPAVVAVLAGAPPKLNVRDGAADVAPKLGVVVADDAGKLKETADVVDEAGGAAVAAAVVAPSSPTPVVDVEGAVLPNENPAEAGVVATEPSVNPVEAGVDDGVPKPKPLTPEGADDATGNVKPAVAAAGAADAVGAAAGAALPPRENALAAAEVAVLPRVNPVPAVGAAAETGAAGVEPSENPKDVVDPNPNDGAWEVAVGAAPKDGA